MRYCLECRRLSADGPLCTSCGRSFGGKLCNHKKGRHLNPPAANVCGQCGSTTLTDAANFIPLTWIGRLMIWSGVAVLLWRFGPMLWHRVGDALGVTRYGDPRIWMVESMARVLMPLAIIFFVFYGIACFVPGEGGKLLRRAMTGSIKWIVQTVIKRSRSLLEGGSRTLMNKARVTKTKQ